MDKQKAQVWENVLTNIKTRVSPANFLTLFRPTFLVSLEDDIATIAAPSNMVIDLLQKRFAADIKDLLNKETGRDVAILFVPKSMPQEDMPTRPAPLFEEQPTAVKPIAGHLPRVRQDFTFSNFAVSSSNQLAFVSSNTVANSIGQPYNPLFIYGPSGVGKTHLMHAIANHVYQNDPQKKIIYITSEEFTNEVVEAIRNNDTPKMKKRFRSAHLLLIDDVQFIEGKERVAEEIFHTFNILTDNGSQIVLSSDRPPHEIKKLEKRLSTRFAGGLTVDIQAPDFELKTAILLIKAKKYGHDLPIEAAKILAENSEDARSLEGLLLRLITIASSENRLITVETARRALGGMAEERKEHVHADDVIKQVCLYYRVKPTMLKGPKREASLVRARQVAMFILKNHLDLTLVEIGNLLGGRDHTTIMHGVEKIETLVEKKDKVNEDILRISHLYRG